MICFSNKHTKAYIDTHIHSAKHTHTHTFTHTHKHTHITDTFDLEKTRNSKTFIAGRPVGQSNLSFSFYSGVAALKRGFLERKFLNIYVSRPAKRSGCTSTFISYHGS